MPKLRKGRKKPKPEEKPPKPATSPTLQSDKQEEEADKREEKATSRLVDWNQLIIQLIFFGGIMFVFQQLYNSSGNHEALKYDYNRTQLSPTEERIDINVYRFGKMERKNINFLFRLNQPEQYSILRHQVRRCENDWFDIFFGSRDECDDLTNTAYSKPLDKSSEASLREFRFNALPPDSVYELNFVIQRRTGAPPVNDVLFRVFDSSIPFADDLANKPTALDSRDYLYLSRLEIFVAALVMVLLAVLIFNKVLSLRRRKT